MRESEQSLILTSQRLKFYWKKSGNLEENLFIIYVLHSTFNSYQKGNSNDMINLKSE